MVPSSKGMTGVWPMQDTLFAVNDDTTKILTLSFGSRKWVEVASGAVVKWMTSPDGALLLLHNRRIRPKNHALRLADHKVEAIAKLSDLRRVVDSIETNALALRCCRSREVECG